MKRTVWIIAVLLCLALLGGIILRMKLPSLIALALGRTLGAKVSISTIDVSWEKGNLAMAMQNVALQGAVSGTIKDCSMSMGIFGGPFFKKVELSDFEVTVTQQEGRGRFGGLPVPFFYASNGYINFQNHRIGVTELRLEQVNMRDSFLFHAVIRDGNGPGMLQMGGEGKYGEGGFSLKGKIAVKDVNLGKRLAVVTGRLEEGQGNFVYDRNGFFVKGPFRMADTGVHGKIFKKSLSLNTIKGEAAFSLVNGAGVVEIRDAHYSGISFEVIVKFDRQGFNSLEITSSGFADALEVIRHVNLGHAAKTSFAFEDVVTGGGVRLTKIFYDRKGSFLSDLGLKDISITTGATAVDHIEGSLRFDGAGVSLKGFSGAFSESTFSQINGTMGLGAGGTTSLKGFYDVSFGDIPALMADIDMGELQFPEGNTKGTGEAKKGKDGKYRFSGNGTVEGVLAARKLNAAIAGSYLFTNNEIIFDPISLKNSMSDVTIRGKLQRGYLDVAAQGTIDMRHTKPFANIPFSLGGAVGIDLAIHGTADAVSVRGDVDMDAMSFEIPGYFRKSEGVSSKATFDLTQDRGNTVVKHLAGNVDILKLQVSGQRSKDGNIGMNLAADADGIERMQPLLLFEDASPQGFLRGNVLVRDLKFPLERLPSMKGYLEVNNGAVKLPWMAKPLREIDLTATFNGDDYVVRIDRIKCGSSALKKGTFYLDGTYTPHFALSLDMDTVDMGDFKGEGDFDFTLPNVPAESLPARARGEITLHADGLRLGNIKGTDVKIQGILSDGSLRIPSATMEMMEGSAALQGELNFSATPPAMSIKGTLDNAASGLFLQAAGARSSVVEGTTTLSVNLESRGRTKGEILSNMKGTTATQARDGVIKRWNILSKAFAILSLKFYDLFRGKMDFTKDGLPYKRMGATFTVNNGIFHTDDFLIDSPSMLITAEGDIDIVKKEIEGNLAVSPLIGLDSAIDNIPLLRSILREKNKGFLYVSYNVKGPIDDPELRLSVATTVGGRVRDILRNLIMLPVGVFRQ